MTEEEKNIIEEAEKPETETPPEAAEAQNEGGCENEASAKAEAAGGCEGDAEGCETEEAAENSKEAEAPGDELQTKFLRLSADFQNYKRRVEKEKSDIYLFANEKIVLQLLEVIDNFDRAMQAAPQGDKFVEGMELILKQLTDILAKNNVSEVASAGAFDPNFHNAVMTEAVEGAESGSITKVFQKGYVMNGKLIRPAMVAVAQ